jgi:hypothetical protein
MPVLQKKKRREVGVVDHSCNPAFGRLRQEDLEFEVNLGYVERP